MSVISVILLVFALLGALDKMFGCRFGLGKQFERGFMILGSISLSMVGMIVLAPVIADVLSPVFDTFYRLLHIDPSIIPVSIFADDMGGASIAKEIARNMDIGMLNGMVVSSMMGCTVSFTVPIALGLVYKNMHRELFIGLCCGVAAIPVGCIVSGLILGINFGVLMLNMLPLILFSVIVVCGLAFAPDRTVKVFSVFGYFINALITFGLALGIYEHFTGVKLIKTLGDLGEAAQICFNASIVLAGAFPLMFTVSKLLKKPLAIVGKATGINQTSAMGFLTTMVNSVPVFESMNQMDKKGVVLNSAFAVSAAFVFGGQLAFTMTFEQSYVPAFMVGKLVSGVAGLAVAVIFCRTKYKTVDTE